jgi:aminoglycoside phosphotransferase (APT) family kinase protein
VAARRARITELRRSHATQRQDSDVTVVHGDAWQGNVAVPLNGGRPILLDLDRIGFGPPEWDLVPVAVDHTDFARINTADYQRFVDALCGVDVTASPILATLAAITQLRWTAFVISKAGRVRGPRSSRTPH